MPLLMTPRISARRVSTPNANVIAISLFLGFVLIGLVLSLATQNPTGIIAGILLGWLFALSPKIANQWERGIVLRLGKYKTRKGPGLFWILPLIDSISTWIDQST